jgi:hypothetical protein
MSRYCWGTVGTVIWRTASGIAVAAVIAAGSTVASVLVPRPAAVPAPPAAAHPALKLPVVSPHGAAGADQVTLTGVTRTARTTSIGVPFGSLAGGVPGRAARGARPQAAGGAMPRQLIVPDLLAAAPSGITKAELAKIRALSGVRDVLAVDGGEITIRGKPANVLGVAGRRFRPWTPPVTAADQAAWQALARGGFVAGTAAARRLALRAGSSYPVTGARSIGLTFGGPVQLGIPGVDAVVGGAVSARLGLVKNVAVLINAPDSKAAALASEVRAVTGPSGQVISLRPTVTRLPVTTSVPSGRPATYLELYQESAARYCPGLSWTVLAAIGEVESGNGANLGPSSAGALGPMQFLPSTWQVWGIDGFGDTGPPDVMNPFDAVPSAAAYLCAHGAAQGGQALDQAIWDYNHAGWYVSEVLAVAREYAQDYPS